MSLSLGIGLGLGQQQIAAIFGPELVINGGFEADTNWTKETGWSIGGGVASCDGTQASNSVLSQQDVVEGSKTYEVTYTLTRSAGTLTPTLGSGGGVALTTRTSGGIYTERVTTNAGATDPDVLQFVANFSFVGTVDKVSVKEVL